MRKKGKAERQQIIETLLKTHLIENQDELLKLLTDKGIDLTQATLSRDIKEMKIAKTPSSDGNYYYKLPSQADNSEINKEQDLPDSHLTSSFLRHGMISMEFSNNLAIIKTSGLFGKSTAKEIKDAKIPGIIGVIADDNSVLIVLRENVVKHDIIRSLSLLFEKKIM